MPILSGTVRLSGGLHARPAALFVRAVNDTGLPILIRKAGSSGGVDARSLLAVMAEDFVYGTSVELLVKDEALGDVQAIEEASVTLKRLVQLLESQDPA